MSSRVKGRLRHVGVEARSASRARATSAADDRLRVVTDAEGPVPAAGRLAVLPPVTRGIGVRGMRPADAPRSITPLRSRIGCELALLGVGVGVAPRARQPISGGGLVVDERPAYASPLVARLPL
jgi:hypothetical protein